jgi:murein DD-endopeptidase MepM/ murein hydrolase activator NlpD
MMRTQTRTLIWAIRGALAALVALLLACALAGQARAGVGLEYAAATPRVAFTNSLGQTALDFELKGQAPRDVQVEVVRRGYGTVRSLPLRGAQPQTPLSVPWDGRNPAGKFAKIGDYVFKLRNLRNGQVVPMKRVRGKRTFSVRDAIFPVRGRHDYGGGAASYGAGRSGHSHQGHDVFARCGTRLVAPMAGRVQVNGYHGSAGHYVVLDLNRNAVDAVFMHLQHRSWAPVGQPIRTGEQIGKVGATGNARGCHLHFEMWGKPGWYEGGRPFNPVRILLAWDSWS